MKWFKHFTRAHEDRAIEKLIMEFGAVGYGLYFYCVEIIAGSLEVDNITFELEPDAEILAHRLKVDTMLVEKIMKRCIDLKLFEMAESGRISCMKIAKFFEQSMTSNPGMRKLFSCKSIQDSKKTDKITEHPDFITEHPDQIRLDKIRIDKNNINTVVSAPVSLKKEKHKYGQYGQEKNVMLTDEQYQSLITELGEEKTLACIEELSSYKAIHGRTYKRDDLAIRKWVVKAISERSGKVADSWDEKARRILEGR